VVVLVSVVEPGARVAALGAGQQPVTRVGHSTEDAVPLLVP
jgi:hypothetical protein